MADDDKPDAPDDKPDDVDDDKPSDDKPDTGDEAAKWKAMARKHEREAKQLATKVKEFEDASKSEQEKITERLADAEKRAATAEANFLRYKVAADKGLPPNMAARLRGDTEEDLVADADELIETLGGKPNGSRPPSFDGGPKDRGAPSGSSFLTQALANRKR